MARTVLTILLCLGLALRVGPGLAEGPETQPGSQPAGLGRSSLTGRVVAALPENPRIAWSFRTGDSITAAVAIDEDRIYLPSHDGHLYALTHAGQRIWTTDLGSPIEGTPRLGGSRVFLGTTSGELVALDRATGKVLWRHETGGKIIGGPNVIDRDGSLAVLAGSYDKALHCLDAATGGVRWTRPTDNYINGTPAVINGHIVFGNCDGMVYLLDATGAIRLRRKVGKYIPATVPVADRTAYVGLFAGACIALDLARGQTLWTYTTPGEDPPPFFAPPAVGASMVILGNRSGELLALDRATGKVRWRYRAGGEINAQATILTDAAGHDQAVLVGASDGRLTALDAAGKVLWQRRFGRGISAPPVLHRGRVLVGTDDGRLLCLEDR